MEMWPDPKDIPAGFRFGEETKLLMRGMSLRDYFATILLPNRDVITSIQTGNPDDALASAAEHARAAYMIADAMLAERSKP
jgi:hypothetical protein